MQMRQIWIERKNKYLAQFGIPRQDPLDYMPKLKKYYEELAKAKKWLDVIMHILSATKIYLCLIPIKKVGEESDNMDVWDWLILNIWYCL